jgi:drug/metabolite transporter (DMT)-like permease
MKKNLVWATALISGVSIFINKFGVSMGNAFVFTFMKNISVAVFFFSMIILLRDFKYFKKLNLKDWRNLVLIGLIGGGIPFLLFFQGLSMTTSANASFIHKTMFIFVGVFAYFFLKERFEKKAAAAVILLLAGNFFLLRVSWQPFNTGDLMILAATLLWAAENTLSKHALKTLNSNIVAFSRMFFGSIFMLGFLAVTGDITKIPLLSMQQVIWIIVTSALLFGYVFTWYKGLKTISVTKASAILLLGSPITTILNLVWLGNTAALAEVIGIFFLVSGVYIFYHSVKEIKLPEPTKFKI